MAKKKPKKKKKLPADKLKLLRIDEYKRELSILKEASEQQYRPKYGRRIKATQRKIKRAS